MEQANKIVLCDGISVVFEERRVDVMINPDCLRKDTDTVGCLGIGSLQVSQIIELAKSQRAEVLAKEYEANVARVFGLG